MEDDHEVSLDGDDVLVSVSDFELVITTLEDKDHSSVDDCVFDRDRGAVIESVAMMLTDADRVRLLCWLIETVRVWAPVSLSVYSIVCDRLFVVEPEVVAERETDGERECVGDGMRLPDADGSEDSDGEKE